MLESSQIDEFAATLEEATRSTSQGVKYFIEPAQGTLSRAKSKRHHLIFGRRGSGKSSLLNKLISEFALSRTPVAYIDLETFKGHSYPDVLVSILIKTLSSYQEWMETAAVYPASKQSFWGKLFGTKPSKKALDNKQVSEISNQIVSLKKDLELLLHEAESVDRKRTSRQQVTRGTDGSLGVQSNSATAKASMKSGRETEKEIVDAYENRKIETLHRRILEFKDLFSRISKCADGSAFLLLDDLYHIRKSDQAMVIDYFHRITKGTDTWLKIGTIRHRTKWYTMGNQAIGVKLGDDADEIDLDVTLERYDLTKTFLIKILDQFCVQYSAKVGDIVSDGARDRLVLASGGVARDFLSLTRRSIDVARRRLAGNDRFRGERISAEDVNKAAGELDSFKQEDFQLDTSEADSGNLRDHFDRLRNFCLENTNCNCILVDKESKEELYFPIRELVDLKFLHHISSRVTVRDKKGKIYDAYMLDISQYSGERKRRNFEMIKFWEKEGDGDLRKSKLVYI